MFLIKLIKKIFSILILIIFILLILNYSIIKKKFIQNINKKTVLLFNINGIIIENKNINNLWDKFNFNLFKIKNKKTIKNTLFNIIKIIRLSKNDKNITGIILKLNNFLGTDQTSLEYIGKILNEFKKSGKPIYAISNNYNQAQYYLASYANKIYMYSNGFIDLHGLYNDKFYYKSLLNKLKINSHIFRIGFDKNAIDTYIYNNMPTKTKISENKWLNKLWLNYIYDISKNRKLKTYNIIPNIIEFLKKNLKKNYINNYNLKNKLIDKILSPIKIKKKLIKIFGLNKNKNNYKFLNFYNYKIYKSLEKSYEISVIFINGKIINYKKYNNDIYNIVNKLKNARLNPNTKAVILKINSPGGNIIASENIRAEVSNLKFSGKPVIVSMGNLCASGGYWISTSANIIIADRSTITGSIGIFNIINTYEKTLNLFGINYDGSNIFPLSSVKLNKNLTPYATKLIELNIKMGYKYFIKLISKNRQLTPKEINNIGQGRIFIGKEAKINKLVDKIGDFDDAVNQAVKLSKLKNWHLNWIK
ncbi:MAG: signal peptide peptidase SppA [Enterobacteriaceae bacterium PSpicST2]|nr:MAG: signal peptide peptidase SppA [Enterobacteriaceae bacterium PSpicST2]WMC19054.1 MAG: signal peptide peptidase SppA [Enterobacteriaceae bacterium PSpicST1]